jgi:hypothetical protein
MIYSTTSICTYCGDLFVADPHARVLCRLGMHAKLPARPDQHLLNLPHIPAAARKGKGVEES